MSLRSRRQSLTLALHLAVALLCACGMVAGLASDHEDVFVLSGVTLLGYVLTLRLNPLPRLVASRIIRQTECPACGQVIDLVGIWRCGCGFVTWRPRHAFSPCPNCGKIFRWLVCPSCEASIPI